MLLSLNKKNYVQVLVSNIKICILFYAYINPMSLYKERTCKRFSYASVQIQISQTLEVPYI